MKRIIFIFFSLFLMGACTSKLDIDQAEKLEIQPVFEGDIFYFDLHKPNLTDHSGNFRSIVTDTVDFSLFDDGKIRDGFIRAEIEVAFNNSFERNFLAELLFTDDNYQTVAQSELHIAPASPANQQVVGDTVFVFDSAANPNFVNFRKIVLKITVSPDTLPVEDKTLHMQTKGTFYTKIILD